MNRLYRFGQFLLVCVLAACTAGEVEFAYYDAAYDVQHNQGEMVLDRMAKAERVVARRVFKKEMDVREFDPNLAGYYLETGDAPATASLRASLRAVRGYNKVLLGLSNGEGAALLRARVSDIVTAIDDGTKPFQAAEGGDQAAVAAAQNARNALAGLCTTCGVAVDFLRQLGPSFDALIGLSTRLEFKNALLAKHEPMKQLLLRLRNGTGDIYNLVVRSESGTFGVRDSAREDLLQFRRELAAWVVMIDQTILAMDAAAEAVSENTGISAESLLSETIKLREVAAKAEAASGN